MDNQNAEPLGSDQNQQQTIPDTENNVADSQPQAEPVIVMTQKPLSVKQCRKRAAIWAICPIILLAVEIIVALVMRVADYGYGSVCGQILLFLLMSPFGWPIQIFAFICLGISVHYRNRAKKAADAVDGGQQNTNEATSDLGHRASGFGMFLLGALLLAPFLLIAYGIISYGRCF